MKKGFFLSVFVCACSLASAVSAAEMKAINFTQKGEVSELEFIFDSNDVQASKFQVKEDKQIIVDLSSITASDRVMRAFDTSQFSGGVVFVKAYKKPKNDKDIRVAIQLRDNVRSVLVRKPNRIILQIENRYGVFSQKKVEDNQSFKEKISEIPSSQAAKLNIPRSESVEDILENITQSGRKKYIGKKISMNLRSVKPDEILKMMADTSGFNIIVTEDVKKIEPISLNLNDVPWDQALDTVLEMNKLVAKKNGMILLVTTYETAAKEREIEKKAKESMVELEPLVTKIFPISYAKIGDLKEILSEYSSDKMGGGGSAPPSGPSGGAGAGKRGRISIDSRTNSLIVKDTAEVIERMKKIVELLDAQTPQVLIESKIVEVSERYSKEIGLDQGLGFGYDPFSASANAGTNNGAGFSFSTAPSATASLFGLSIKRFNKLINLDFQLKLMESESKGKIISSPKVITKNNVAANITQDESTYFLDTNTTTGTTGVTTTTAWKAQTSRLELAVTPQVTNEGSISLEVEVKKDSLNPTAQIGAPQDEVKRVVKTQVLVDNGATVVIGGIYSYSQSENHSGIPFLKDVPLIGWLFRTKYNPASIKKELIIFLTPRIINQEEAGLVDRG
ncbi:MAG: type IV pilus secretin PilQ [Bacteriovorax sp.]|nr:type IV pilus secretin PilQ [Bacteriovorax sp.]